MYRLRIKSILLTCNQNEDLHIQGIGINIMNICNESYIIYNIKIHYFVIIAKNLS